MAECLHRNVQQMQHELSTLTDDNTTNNLQGGRRRQCLERIIEQARKARVRPLDWGKSVDLVLEPFQNNTSSIPQHADIVLAADCCYMPWLHHDLLTTISNLLPPPSQKTVDTTNDAPAKGVAILSFALHGNTDDEEVWKIVDRAREQQYGFDSVEILESKQLVPQKAAMDKKQALVHTIRLIRRY